VTPLYRVIALDGRGSGTRCPCESRFNERGCKGVMPAPSLARLRRVATLLGALKVADYIKVNAAAELRLRGAHWRAPTRDGKSPRCETSPRARTARSPGDGRSRGT